MDWKNGNWLRVWGGVVAVLAGVMLGQVMGGEGAGTGAASGVVSGVGTGVATSGTTTGAGGKVAAKAGEIRAEIASSQAVIRAVAIDREWADVLKTSEWGAKDEFVYEGKVEAREGGATVTVKKLLPGRSYDLVVWTTSGKDEQTRWEGVNMDFVREFARPAVEEKATEEDRKWLTEFVEKIPSFYDKSRILWMAADHKHATVLVELMRTRDFYASKEGEVIYRAELWYFENYFGGWEKDRNTEKVLVRWRLKGERVPKNWQFVPGMGGIVVNEETGVGEVKVELPAKAEGKRGLAGGVPAK